MSSGESDDDDDDGTPPVLIDDSSESDSGSDSDVPPDLYKSDANDDSDSDSDDGIEFENDDYNANQNQNSPPAQEDTTDRYGEYDNALEDFESTQSGAPTERSTGVSWMTENKKTMEKTHKKQVAAYERRIKDLQKQVENVKLRYRKREDEFKEAKRKIYGEKNFLEKVNERLRVQTGRFLESGYDRSKVKKVCNNCKKKAKKLYYCTRCKNACYCSKKCQRSHHRLHKHECFLNPMKNNSRNKDKDMICEDCGVHRETIRNLENETIELETTNETISKRLKKVQKDKKKEKVHSLRMQEKHQVEMDKLQKAHQSVLQEMQKFKEVNKNNEKEVMEYRNTLKTIFSDHEKEMQALKKKSQEYKQEGKNIVKKYNKKKEKIKKLEERLEFVNVQLRNIRAREVSYETPKTVKSGASTIEEKEQEIRRLKNIIEDLQSQNVCKICTERDVDRCMAPCGHIICRPCLKDLRKDAIKGGKKKPLCPWCRKTVKGDIKFYQS